MPKTVFDIGEKAGFLTIIAELPKRPPSTARRYLVRCNCGTEKAVSGRALWTGQVSCGCHRRAVSRIQGFRNRRHGESGKRSPEYQCWRSMVERCRNPNLANFKYYGARGIKVCDRWLESYENFLLDMGRRPSPAHSIDRIDNDGNYEPENCRWATKSEQVFNQRKRGQC